MHEAHPRHEVPASGALCLSSTRRIRVPYTPDTAVHAYTCMRAQRRRDTCPPAGACIYAHTCVHGGPPVRRPASTGSPQRASGCLHARRVSGCLHARLITARAPHHCTSGSSLHVDARQQNSQDTHTRGDAHGPTAPRPRGPAALGLMGSTPRRHGRRGPWFAGRPVSGP